LFDDLWNYDQPAETEHAFRRLLPAARTAGDRSYLAQLLTQIARTQGLQRQFEQAHTTLDEAQALLDGQSMVARIRYLLERGRVFNSAGEQIRARLLFLQAWEDASARGEDFYAVDAAHMLAIVKPAEEQLAWNRRALELAERSPDPRARRWLGSLYNNIAWTYHDAGQYGEALAMFQQALEWQRARGKARETRIAEWCVARTRRSLSHYKEALERQRTLWEAAQEAGDSDGFIQEELGECLLALGREEEARPWFSQAHQILSQDPWLTANEPARIVRLKELADPEA
jgi:tetratricopeptide (TPR) repeat protein